MAVQRSLEIQKMIFINFCQNYGMLMNSQITGLQSIWGLIIIYISKVTLCGDFNFTKNWIQNLYLGCDQKSFVNNSMWTKVVNKNKLFKEYTPMPTFSELFKKCPTSVRQKLIQNTSVPNCLILRKSPTIYVFKVVHDNGTKVSHFKTMKTFIYIALI